MMRLFSPRRRGMTVIEVMVYAVIFSVTMITVIQLMLFVLQARRRNQVRLDLEQGLRTSMERVSTVLRSSKGVLANNTPTSLVVDESGFPPPTGFPQTTFAVDSNGVFTVQELGQASALSLTPPGVRVTAFQVTSVQGTSPLPIYRLQLSGTFQTPDLPLQSFVIETSVSQRQ